MARFKARSKLVEPFNQTEIFETNRTETPLQSQQGGSRLFTKSG